MDRNSCNVSWTPNDPNYSYNYTITWINLNTNKVEGTVMVQDGTTSGMVREFNGIDNYNVSVTTTCGMMESEPMTVYGKD